MRLGLRAKLFAVSVLLVVAGGGAAAFLLERELRAELEAGIEDELERHARTARAFVETARSEAIARIDPLADRLSDETGMRVTIIGRDGVVLGESELTPSEILHLDNHANRPEVIDALRGGIGRSRRYSTTAEKEMMYVALPSDREHAGWVIRVAKPLSDVDAAIGRLRRAILVAGAIGLLAAAFMSALASNWMVKALRELAERARRIARGERPGRIDDTRSDEIGTLAGSLNELAGSVQSTVRELASERARLETVLEALSDGVVALDGERRVTVMNRAAEQLLDAGHDAVGRPLVDLIRTPALQELVAGGAEGKSTAEFDLPDGRRVLARVTPQRGGQGSVLVLADVSALRRLETVRRDFVANVSHELRTPVSVVQATAETLLDGAIEDRAHARPMVEALHRHAERMSRLVSDLLDLSRLESGRYELSDDRVDIGAAARRAAESVESAAATRGTRVDIDAPADLLARADAKALDQVLVNLLDNAVKHTPDHAHVNVRASARDSRIRIEVADDGPGIPEAHRSRIFERFYRIDPGRSRDMGGTGLGLSIVKHLVEAMHGQVGVSGGSPRGSVFWVELPRAS